MDIQFKQIEESHKAKIAEEIQTQHGGKNKKKCIGAETPSQLLWLA
ncbi:hypothetical protein M5D96_000316 [Drosophila gunungcola]|uniref:Uncharacterized protein n=1 Tax=Drosophila gunungcola TaxID=103775 RepID=A0A9Q0BU99_9MUSC|nr:hypothetical protein M5D96_000316 [Drosophila gunungcola]